jgi:hypothetical protein
VESDTRLVEDPRASVSFEIRPEHVEVPVYSVYHTVQDLNGEIKKGVSSLNNSFCESEAAKLQKERTTPLHSGSQMPTKVEELLWYNSVDELTHVILKLA